MTRNATCHTGLYVLGHRVSRHDVDDLYSAMGVADGGLLRFSELRRQLRVVANRGNSAYLRAATKQVRSPCPAPSRTPRVHLPTRLDGA